MQPQMHHIRYNKNHVLCLFTFCNLLILSSTSTRTRAPGFYYNTSGLEHTHLPRLGSVVLIVTLLQVHDVELRTQENRASAVNGARDHVEDTLSTGGGDTAGLLGKEGHGEGLVEHTELAVLALLVVGVAEDTSVEESTVHVGDHGSNVTGRVGLAVGGELDGLEVLEGGGVEVERVTLVERVDLATVGDADVRVGEDELSEGLVESEAVNTLAGGEDKVARGAVPGAC